MLFCFTGHYTQQALQAMAASPDTDRQAATAQLIEAAGGKLIAMYGTGSNGPGVMIIFDVQDPQMAIAMSGVSVSTGTIQNAQVTRLFTMDVVA